MRIFSQLSVVVLLIFGSAGCDNGSAPGDSGSAAAPGVSDGSFPSAGQSGAQAPYGVIVDLSYPADATALGADARVYVFLRKAGERMPLALQYFAAADLPKRVSLATSEALSGVELIARLSFSGRVERSAEDLEVSQWLASVGHPPETVALQLQTGGVTQMPPDDLPGPETACSDVKSLDVAEQPRVESVSVRIRITAEQAVGYPPDSTVFVVARNRTNPMPLAVKKLALADLPIVIELSDADAMMFSHRLSTADVFTLVARISRSGDAVRSDSDLESPAVAIDAAAIPPLVTLAISGAG